MRPVPVLCSFLFVASLWAALAPRIAQASLLEVESGEVRYAVTIKTLGIGGSKIVGKNRALIGKIQVGKDGWVQGGLVIPVVKFESNNSRRDKDVAKILKYEEYPAITFEIVGIAKADIHKILNTDGGEVPIKAKISVAGGAKVYDMTLAFQHSDGNRIRCSTSVDAKFTDFGLEPPSFGFILKTAPDALTLSGDLLLEVLEK